MLGVACLAVLRRVARPSPDQALGRHHRRGHRFHRRAADGRQPFSCFNRQERPFGKALTDERGEFKFLGLFPDLYSIRVTLASFVPALKKDILVQPGMRSVLNVNLSTLFSSIQLAYPPIENGSLMTDEWKWVLRSAPSTRPVLRFAEARRRRPPEGTAARAVFSDTRGIVKLSAGEGALAAGIGERSGPGHGVRVWPLRFTATTCCK